MKRFYVLALTLVCMLSLAVCCNNNNTTSNNSNVSINAVTPSDESSVSSQSSSISSSTSTGISTNTSSPTQYIHDTGMNLKQIQAGNYSSLLGKWKGVAYAVNPLNCTGEQWKAGTPYTLSVSSDKIKDGSGDFVIQGNTLKDNAGSHTLSFENNGSSLVASLTDENVAINWAVYFYPKGVINDIQTNNKVKIDNTKNLIVIWSSNNGFTEVFEQTNASNSASKYPFIKITQIKNFYNNDYYGKILNYRINSNVVNGEKRYIVDYNVEYPQLYKIKNKRVKKKSIIN